MRLSRTLIDVNNRRPSGTMAIPRSQKQCDGNCDKSSPSNANAPATMRLSPATTLISVVLPAPLGPTTQTSSPARIVNDTSHSAVAAPYFASIASIRSMLLSQECRDDVRLLHHIRGFPFGDDCAVVENDHTIGERHHG